MTTAYVEPDWRALVDAFHALGARDAWAEHTGGGIVCVFVPDGVNAWIIGDANETWCGQLLDEHGDVIDDAEFETWVPATNHDAAHIARACLEAIRGQEADI